MYGLYGTASATTDKGELIVSVPEKTCRSSLEYFSERFRVPVSIKTRNNMTFRLSPRFIQHGKGHYGES
jgi:hypothetical protein